MVVFRHQPNSTQTNLAIYKEGTLGGADRAPFAKLTWSAIGETSNKTFLLSPETFTFNNNTYVLFSTADARDIPEHTTGSIWIAKLNHDGSFNALKISAIPPRVRVEPEAYFASPASVPVFFYNQYSNAAEPSCPVLPCLNGAPFCLQNFNLRRIVLTAQELP